MQSCCYPYSVISIATSFNSLMQYFEQQQNGWKSAGSINQMFQSCNYVRDTPFSYVIIQPYIILTLLVCCRNISYNNFSGVLPIERNFSRFSPDRYVLYSLASPGILYMLYWLFASFVVQLYWQSIFMWQLVRFNLWPVCKKIQRCSHLSSIIIPSLGKHV